MATWGLGGGETARAGGRTLLFECRGPWVETQDQALLGARTSGAPQRRGSGRKCVLCPGARFLVSGWERLYGEDKSLLGPGLGFHQELLGVWRDFSSSMLEVGGPEGRGTEVGETETAGCSCDCYGGGSDTDV